MGKPRRRFIAKAESEKGWRIWDNLQKKWWGERYVNFPEELLTELNGHKRPDELKELIRQAPRKRLPRPRA